MRIATNSSTPVRCSSWPGYRTESPTGLLAWRVLNFAVIAGVVFWVSEPGCRECLATHGQHPESDGERATASEEADRRLAGIEARLSKLDVEIDRDASSCREGSRSRRGANSGCRPEEGRKIAEAAEEEIAAAGQTARRELTAYAADLAVTLAGKQIMWMPRPIRRLVRSFAAAALRQRRTSGSDGR